MENNNFEKEGFMIGRRVGRFSEKNDISYLKNKLFGFKDKAYVWKFQKQMIIHFPRLKQMLIPLMI